VTIGDRPHRRSSNASHDKDKELKKYKFWETKVLRGFHQALHTNFKQVTQKESTVASFYILPNSLFKSSCQLTSHNNLQRLRIGGPEKRSTILGEDENVSLHSASRSALGHT
jgi:hypothetical protein